MNEQDMQFEEERPDASTPTGDAAPPAEKPKPEPRRLDLPVASRGGAPDWVDLPANFKFPRGKSIIFLKFKSAWTDTPWKGDPILDPATGEAVTETIYVDGEEVQAPVLWRQCVVWPLNIADKKLAMGRSMGDPFRAQDELSRQMIRVADGEAIDWSGAGSVDVFWNDLGEKCRGLLTRIYNRLHVMDTEATVDFLANCVEVRTSGS